MMYENETSLMPTSFSPYSTYVTFTHKYLQIYYMKDMHYTSLQVPLFSFATQHYIHTHKNGI